MQDYRRAECEMSTTEIREKGDGIMQGLGRMEGGKMRATNGMEVAEGALQE